MARSKVMLRTGICLLAVGIIFASGAGSSAQKHHGVKGGGYKHNADTSAQALESIPASEVEYVDGPLAPLYDFLIQKKLFKFCKLLRDAQIEQILADLGGSWTLFAPTDASFIFLPAGSLEELQRNPQLLREFILYHFVTGDFPSNQIQNEMMVESVQGANLRFNIYGQVITVSGAQILEPDLTFDLGRIYIIDRPLYPIPSEDMITYMQKNLKEYYRILFELNLVDYISSGTFTILVPEDEAFDYLSAELKGAFSSNRTLGERIVLNHVILGSLYVGGITDGMQVETVGGDIITFTVKRGITFANDIPIILSDVPVTNGVIHVVNRVLLPQGIENDCQCKASSDTRKKTIPSQGKNDQTFGQRPQQGQKTTTPRSWQRQTPRPTAGSSGHGRPTITQGRPVGPSNTDNRHWSPTRTAQTVNPIPSPNQITRSPYEPKDTPQSDDDINTVIDTGKQPNIGQKKPDEGRVNRYPTPTPWQRQTPYIPPHRITSTENVKYPVKDITAPPSRGSYQTPVTRKPPTTRTYDWNQKRTTHKQTNVGFDTATSQPEQISHTQRTTKWEQKQVQRTTKLPTERPSRIPSPPPQRTSVTTRSPYIPPGVAAEIIPEIPFDSSREQPNCRLKTERITSVNRNYPICDDLSVKGCQDPPYNPSDSRPLCIETTASDCRDTNAPYNPSDLRPVCPSKVNKQNCREFGKPTYVGDRRPLCPGSNIPQTGCKDSSSPYDPSDRRPVCQTDSAGKVPSSSGNVKTPGGCRHHGEIKPPQDQRPVCSTEISPQSECKDPRAPYDPSDRRPVCQTKPPGRLPPGLEDTTVNEECRSSDETANPNDRRPLCQTDTVPEIGCKDPRAPYNPSDRRPICRESAPNIRPTTPEDSRSLQGCRPVDEIAGYNDRRPVCPSETVPQTGCKDPRAPYNPSDRRPICRTSPPTRVPAAEVPQGCRRHDEIASPHDRRPMCPTEPNLQLGCKDPNAPYVPSDRRPICQETSPVTPKDTTPQTGCKDPRAPYNPTDRRPICRNVPEITPFPDNTIPSQACRPSAETAYPGDVRPLCPEQPQEDCRSFLERPKPGDTRPLCKINKQTPTQTTRKQTMQTSTKSLPNWQTTKAPQSWQTTRAPQSRQTVKATQSWQTSKTSQHTQTTRTTQSWQTTKSPHSSQNTRAPQNWQNTRSPQSWQSTTSRQPIDKQRQGGGIKQPTGSYPTGPQSVDHPSQPQDENLGHQPSPGGYPSQPQSGAHHSQPQAGSYPSPPRSPQSSNYPSGPHAGAHSPHPQRGTNPAQPQFGRQPSHSDSPSRVPTPGADHSQSVSTPSQPNAGVPPQTGSVKPSQPHSGQGHFQPGRPTSHPRHQQDNQQSRYTTPAVYPTNQGTHPSGSADGKPPQGQAPLGRPVSGPGHQTGTYTTTPRRPVSTTSTTIPTPMTGTSINPEDSRRTLYEIVEAPALLIRGRPVKLTKILALFQKAGLEDILLGPGPTTVFLPSDDAFATLPKGVVEQLEENPELLRQVISYHVTKSEILPSAQGESYTVPSLEGTQLVITMLNGGRLILISGAKAVAVTRANNGIFYVINQLLYPLPHHNIVGAVQSRPDLSTLTFLLSQTNLGDLLQGETPYTLLAPTDNAFAQMSPFAYEELTKNTTLLQEILLNHLIEGAHYGREFLTGGTFPSLRGGKLRFGVVSYGYQVNDINIKTPEIVTGTGVIHLIDQVLLEDSDLRFFEKLEKTLARNGNSNANTQQPSIPQNTGPLVPSYQLHSQPQIGGLQPMHGQPAPVNTIPSHGQQISTNQGTYNQPHSHGQTHGEQHQTNTRTAGQPNYGSPGSSNFGGRHIPTHGASQPTVPQPHGSRAQPHGSGAGGPPRGSSVQPHGSGSQPNVPLNQPHGSGVQPHGFGGQQHQSGSQPHGPLNQPHGSVRQPYGSVGQPHGSVGQPHGSVGQAHGSVGQPHGSGGQPHGSGGQPHGSGVQPHVSGSQQGHQTRGHHQSGQNVHSLNGGQRAQIHSQHTQSGTFVTQEEYNRQPGSHSGNQPLQGGGQPNDVADLARSMGLNKFANWISNTGLLEKVHDGGVYTVFAPTDEAVDSLPENMLHSIESNPQEVKSILQYHIIPQTLNLNSLTNEETSSTLLNGKNIRFNVYPNSQPHSKQVVTASGTPVGESLATMGSIQVIPVSQVLYQPAGNLLKIIEASPILQQLSECVKSAKVTWILSGNGPITIFAPSDTAFAALTEDEKNSLLNNKQKFTDLLKRHTIRGTIFSSGVQEDVEKKSENHKPIKLSLQEGVLTVNSIPVTFSDITASNGVLHVIDQFL